MRITFPFNQDIEKIFKLLNYNCRLVGGCVRDYLLFNELVDDIDIATPLLSDEVMYLLKKEFNVIPTGLEHGTITVIGEKKYEITTLRKDEKTDGRHAIVSFHSTYEEDAARRDFTMNALYCDYGGNIYDYFNGLADLDKKFIKFIGDPESRIKEDYLRILRFFRFTMRFGALNLEGLNACYKLKEGLLHISRERITQEWFKIINGQYFFKFFKEFKEIMEIIKLTSQDKDINLKDLSSLGLTSCFINEKSMLCLSNAQKKYIHELKIKKLKNQTDANILYNKQGEKFIKDKMIIEKQIFDLVKIDLLPITGSDLIALGYKGKKIGDILKKLEYYWYESFGNLSKSDLIKLIR